MQRIILAPRTDSMTWIAELVGTPVDIAMNDDRVWIRYASDLDSRLAGVPGERFIVDDAGRLVRRGKQVPEAMLPELSWQPIDSLVDWQWPTAGLAGQLNRERLPTLSLVRSSEEHAAAAGLFQWDSLATWAESAWSVRLRGLQYALSGELCLVIGRPLPTIPCLYLWQCDNVLLPLGRTWSPAIPITDLKAAMGANESSWLVWLGQDDWSIVDDSLFGPLSRSSLRAIAARRDGS